MSEERDITLARAVEVVAEHTVTALEPFPAGIDLVLGSGEILRFFPGDRDAPDTWEYPAERWPTERHRSVESR